MLNILSKYTCTFQARVNVPGLSERTLRRHIVDTEFSNNAKLQVNCCWYNKINLH